MALIDVTEVLTDPNFLNPVQIIVQTATVNQYGQNSIVDSAPINTYGSVQPASSKEVERLPETMRVRNIRKFWVKANLGTNYPVKIISGGITYQVLNVGDWMTYGAGYCEGLCVAEGLMT